MIEIKIPFKTPTVNNLYTPWKGRMILKKEARKIKEAINYIVDQTIGNVFKNRIDTKLKVKIEIHENWYTLKGDVKRKDIANREKFLVDSIFESLGLEDKYIFEHSMKKVQSKEEFAIIKIEEFKWQN